MSSLEDLDEFSQRIVEGKYSTSEESGDLQKVLNVLEDSEKALDIAQRKGTSGRNALHNALIKGEGTSAIVTRLVEVYPEGLKVSCDLGLFPIHRAIEHYASVGTITSLLDLCTECASHVMAQNGFLPVHFLCRTASRPDKERILIAEQLLTSHPSCLSVRDKNGDLPIHLAAMHPARRVIGNYVTTEDFELLQFLVEKRPASARCKDARGNLPVHLWFRQNKGSRALSLPKFLVDEYPEIISKKDEFAFFPVHLVAQKGSVEDFKYLVEKYPECLGFQDAEGNYPIHTFLLNEESRHFPKSMLTILKDRPALLRKEDASGRLPIHLVVRNGYYSDGELIQTMVDMFPGSLLHKDKEGKLPIHFASDSSIETLARLCPQSLRVEGGKNFPEFPMVSYLRKNKVPKYRLEIVQQVLKTQYSQSSDEGVKQESAQQKGRLEVKEQLVNTLEHDKESSLQHEINDMKVRFNQETRELQGRLGVKDQLVNTLENDNESLQHEINDMKVRFNQETRELKGRLGVKEQLVNTLENDKETLQDEIKDMKVHLDYGKQIAENARIFEKTFTAKIHESQTDLQTLKSFASMLKARLDARASAKEESSAKKPSWLHRTFPSLVRDPEVSRSVLIDCIEAFDAELTVLEADEGVADECNNAITTDAEGNTQEQEHCASSELPEHPGEARREAVTIIAEEQEKRPAKRARVSLP